MAPRAIGPRAGRAVVCALVAMAISVPAMAQTEPLRVRRNFIGMHNLKDGGPPVLTGFHWTKNLSGDTGFVFDWVFDYSLTSSFNWVGEAIQLNLVPCVRVQNCNGGCTPDSGYPADVAAQILAWKLAHPQYADRLVYMQLWNEPGDPRDYVPMDVFADFMVAAHAGVHNAEANAALQNPDVIGTMKTMTPGQNNPDSWEDGFHHNPAAAFAFDVWGTHPYPESYPPHYNMHEGHGFVTKHKMIDGYLRDLDKCAEYGRRGLRVMITETDYGDHLGISYEGYPKTTRQMAADYCLDAYSHWWYSWPELIAVHPYLLSNLSWQAFEWVQGGSSKDDDPPDGILEPVTPYPQYTVVRDWRIQAVNAGELAPARLTPYRGATGTLQGIVTRSDTGGPVKYANVYTDGHEFGGPTLFDGMYVVYDVPVGTYTLTVEKRGYLPASRQITITENNTTVADFSLIYEGKVPEGFYFVDCGAPGIPCMGSCSNCSLFATVHGQTFHTPDDVGFIKYCAAKPNVGYVTLKFTIIEGTNPDGPVVGSFNSYYLDTGGEMIGGEAPGDGIPVNPDSDYFLKIERTDGQGIYLYTSDSNPYPDGNRWVGNTSVGSWDIYGVIRGNTVAVVTATGSITGTVKDTGNTPISGATVSTSPGNYSASTAGDGTYTIADVPVGSDYVVSASKSGYSTGYQSNVTVNADTATVVNFSLEPGPTTGTISGTVRDGSSNPVAGAFVETTPGNYNATTNSSGSYVITGVAPGTYDVVAAKSGYNPGTNDNVTVTAGQTSVTDIILAPPAPFAGLANWNFENGSFDDPDPDHRTGNSWHQFTTAGFSKSGVTWLGSGAHSADYVQDFWEGGYTSGIYQQVTASTQGGTYTGSVWVKGADTSVAFSVGIDPTGGTNPSSGSIQWSSPVTPGTSWTQISKQVAAQGPTLTLFCKAQNSSGASRNAYFDDANLTEDSVPALAPTIGVSTSTLSPVVNEGSNAASSVVTISNVGDGALLYSVTDNAGWLSVSPDSGLSTGEGDTLTVSYSTASLNDGNYVATITVSDPNATNNPQEITVNLTVNDTDPPPATIASDFDGDNDVDVADFAHLQTCFSGATVTPPSGCDDADLDDDTDVDVADFAVFSTCFSGANNPPACAP